MTYKPQYNRTGSVAAGSANSGANTGDQSIYGLLGDGLVTALARPARSIVSMSAIVCVPELANKTFILTTAATGLLYIIDPITREAYQIASYASKSLANGIYSPNSGLLYIGYGASAMSVSPTTGAIVTSGIVAGVRYGLCIRPVDGVIYGGENGSGQIKRLNTLGDTAGGGITMSFTINTNSLKAVTYCDPAYGGNDSVYVLAGNTKVVRIDCGTNLEAAVIAPAGLVGGSGGGTAVYSKYDNKIYATVSTGAANLVQINPNSDAQEAAYPLPAGSPAAGCLGMISMGRYLYLGTASSSPGEILVFDCLTKAFIGSLNSASGGSTTGAIMAGELGAAGSDSYVDFAVSGTSSWSYIGGR